jgi:hypothetical protein
MKTTVEIADALFDRVRRHAQRTGKPMRALFEEGLRRVLEDAAQPEPYVMPDRSVGSASDENPLESMSWQDLRAAIYGDD